jgi:EmrB/QacA subfamily drug resistance transporter
MTKERSRWIALVFISAAISLVIIDGTIVNTIFPSIINALGLDSTEVQWVQESYVLVFAALLLVWGSIADRIGRKRLLLIGIAIFVAASVWAGLSEDASSMILARVLQGFGGSMVLPTTLSLVNATFQGKERGIAFAVWGATIGGMVAVGPVLGGWLATDFGADGWRLAFNINLPLGLIVMAGLWWWAKESKQEQRVPGVDIVGAVLSVIMFATLVFGLIEGRVYGWWDASTKNQFTLGEFAWPTEGLSIIPVSLAISAAGFVLFVLWERARAKANKAVLLDLDLFHVGSFRNGSIAALIISMGEFGILFAIPLWLQNVLLLSPIESGMVLLWLAGGAFLASGVTGGLSGKVSPKVLVQGGVALELVGAIGIALFANTEAGMWSIAPFLFLYGIGVGMATAQLTGVIMVDVPMDKIGQASGSQSTVRQVGSALGIAVLGTMLFTGVQSSLETRIADQVTDEVQSAKIVELVVDSAGGVIPGLTDLLQSPATGAPLSPEVAKQITEDAGQAFTDGAKSSAWAAAAFLLLGLISTFNIGSAKAKTPAKSGAKE